jgi:hypothetical protein
MLKCRHRSWEFPVSFNSPINPRSSIARDVSDAGRPFPPVGLIVDGCVADATGIVFRREASAGAPVARTHSASGVEVVIVKRSQPHATSASKPHDSTVETLTELGVRQVLAISHRLLNAPADQYGRKDDALTVGVLAHSACTRLFSASFDCIDNASAVDGVFLRDPDDESSSVLSHEARLARINGFCVCLIEATTLRSDPQTRASEERLAEVILQIPDAISPLSACYCQNISTPHRSGC